MKGREARLMPPSHEYVIDYLKSSALVVLYGEFLLLAERLLEVRESYKLFRTSLGGREG